MVERSFELHHVCAFITSWPVCLDQACIICRRAKAAAAARGEPRTPPPKVNCTYDWAGDVEAEEAKKGFLSRFGIGNIKPFLEKKNSGRPVQRHELSAIAISGAGNQFAIILAGSAI